MLHREDYSMPSSLFGTHLLFVIFGGLAVMIVGHANVWQKGVPMWLVSGLLGIFVGAGIVVVAVHGQHNESDAVLARPKRRQEECRALELSQTNESANSGMSARGGAGGGSGGGAASGASGGNAAPRGGPSGGGPAGGAPGGGSRARRDLTMLIGKLELLT